MAFSMLVALRERKNASLCPSVFEICPIYGVSSASYVLSVNAEMQSVLIYSKNVALVAVCVQKSITSQFFF